MSFVKNEVVSVEENEVVIAHGKWEMKFSEVNGKVKKISHKNYGGREQYIPKEIFNPAIKRAGAILHDKKSRKTRK